MLNDTKINIVVGIATAGRRDVLVKTLQVLSKQTRLPNRLVICPASDADADGENVRNFPSSSEVVVGPRGSTAQRNAILSACKDADVIVFFDDDFLPKENYLAQIDSIFSARPDIVAATGHVIADGINGPGISNEEGLAILARDLQTDDSAELTACYGTYGCNMAFRLDVVRRHGVVFDERLPLYGWQEDIDFSRQLAPYGEIVHSRRLRGVHLGIKSGRSSGVKFGYSQVVNPIYLARKGTFSWPRAVRFISKNMVANALKSFKSEPWVDRRGRLKGNFIGIGSVLAGKVDPERILTL